MSWIRSSKSTTLLVLFVVAAAAVGTAAAVSVSSTESPEEAQVGQEITLSATMSDLYAESNDWTLNGTSQLRNVTGWEVVKTLPNGSETTTTFEGQRNFSVRIRNSENLDTVTVSITGTVPPVEAYSYRPRQTFVAGEFERVVGGNSNTIDRITVHHYTNESRDAREQISQAEGVINGSGSDEAQSDLEGAISSYENGNFPNAVNLSQSARSTAESAQESQQTTQLILMGAGAVLVLALLGGGIYYYRSQQDDYDKLR